MAKLTRTIPLLLALTGCAGGPGLQGQQMDPEISAKEIATLLRTERHGGLALRILTQVSGTQPRQRLDEIADTVAAVAITYGLRPGGESAHIAGAARDILLLSAVTREGVPYAGAGERLLRIAEEARDGGALWGLTQLPDRREGLPHLRKVATSRSSLANEAVGFLAREMGPEGLAIVRELYERDLVPHPWARRELAGIAHHHGWTR